MKIEMESKEGSDISCDDRKKNFDISHVHFTKTMSRISKLRSRQLLFDVQIISDGKTFQVIRNNLFSSASLNVGQDLRPIKANDLERSQTKKKKQKS